MTQDDYNFMLQVQARVKANPELAPYVTQFASEGVREALTSVSERAADMETALAVALAKRWTGGKDLIVDKLNKWNGRSALNWSDTITTLATTASGEQK